MDQELFGHVSLVIGQSEEQARIDFEKALKNLIQKRATAGTLNSGATLKLILDIFYNVGNSFIENNVSKISKITADALFIKPIEDSFENWKLFSKKQFISIIKNIKIGLDISDGLINNELVNSQLDLVFNRLARNLKILCYEVFKKNDDNMII